MKTMKIMTTVAVLVLVMAVCNHAGAHCDTLGGPVVQDARKALAARDVTPVLKWVQAKDEKQVKTSFARAMAAQGKKQQQAEEMKFFESMVRIHRAGEGAAFTGLKPAGTVEPVIAMADKALEQGSADGLITMVDGTVNKGIRERFQRVAEALKHKDENVAKGREYVAAYVDYTHYLERLQQSAGETGAHRGGTKEHAAPGEGHRH
ncbi:DUF6448 family protein [Geotalea sp. SG265]|uniref:DUF6448 family protein n=1 Tax=Geotalea sp. SG265 TaxID=2922867 RepID=UPI0024356720|nr:DUF6448 family protein [Geotalea sp. SG265]